jgi:ERF superfamily
MKPQQRKMMSVYKAINAVQAALAHSGIGKDRRNQQQGYSFRGIDDVYNTLSPLLAKHGLCILPRMISRVCEERAARNGGALFYVTVEAEFDFVCSDDGSKHTCRTFGEAMDSADKATNKAMSAAYKYAAFQAFAIPTEGDNDADAQSHDVKSRHAPSNTDQTIVNPDRVSVLVSVAEAMRDKYAAEDVVGAFEEYECLTDSEERAYVWALLKADSKLRSAVKAHGQSLKCSK